MIERCPQCNEEVIAVSDGGATLHYETVNPTLDSNKKKYPIPFWCSICGAIKFPLRPLGDKIFLFSDPIETHIGVIEIPATYRKEKRRTGTVVAVGKGYYDDKGRYHKTTLEVGERVSYNFTVPWKMTVKGSDGKDYRVELMGERDVQLILESDFDERTLQ